MQKPPKTAPLPRVRPSPSSPATPARPFFWVSPPELGEGGFPGAVFLRAKTELCRKSPESLLSTLYSPQKSSEALPKRETSPVLRTLGKGPHLPSPLSVGGTASRLGWAKGGMNYPETNVGEEPQDGRGTPSRPGGIDPTPSGWHRPSPIERFLQEGGSWSFSAPNGQSPGPPSPWRPVFAPFLFASLRGFPEGQLGLPSGVRIPFSTARAGLRAPGQRIMEGSLRSESKVWI